MRDGMSKILPHATNQNMTPDEARTKFDPYKVFEPNKDVDLEAE